MSELTTHTLHVPGAVLTYDVRRNESNSQPALLLIGSPMTADGFAALAGHFPDRTVVTYDPRGVGRSPRADGATASTPEEHAGDLHALISALGAGLVDLFGSSGGAVNALALVARHPEQVRTLVAHEPPAAVVLSDRELVLAACVDIRETYERSGFGPAMAKFIALVSIQGPLPPDYGARPAPDPATFGLPTHDDGSRNDPLLGPHMVWVTRCQLDFDALRAVPTRIVLGVGAESAEMMPGRAAAAVARELGTKPVIFPGGHGGFQGNGHGQPGGPDAFAATLRQVLAAAN